MIKLLLGVVFLAGNSCEGHGLAESVGGLVAGDGAGLSTEGHCAGVTGGGGLGVELELETGDLVGRFCAEDDGVGEGLIVGDGLDSETVAILGHLQGGLSGRENCSNISGNSGGYKEGIVVFVGLENVLSVHGD